MNTKNVHRISYKVGVVTEEDYLLHMVRKEETRLEKDKDKKE